MATIPTASKSVPMRQKTRLAILFFMVIGFPILMNYLSVFLIIEGSAKGIMVFSFFFWAAWVVAALFFGRAACGWICPLGAFQETKDRMVPKDLVRIRHLRWVKYLFAIAWVGAIAYFAAAAGGYQSVQPFYNLQSGVSVDSAQGWFMWGTIVLLLMLPAFLMGRRAFCHYFCPWGVLNMVGSKTKDFFRWPSLHLEGARDSCRQCRTCQANCPMSLSVGDMIHAGSVRDNECILCGTCVDNCPNGAIKFSWGRPSPSGLLVSDVRHTDGETYLAERAEN